MKKNWHKGNITNNYRKFGADKNGMYSKTVQTPLTDTPPVSEELQECICQYISTYRKEHGQTPAYTHLNRRYGLRASKAYYRGLDNET